MKTRTPEVADLRQRMARLAAAYRRATPLPPPPHAAGSFPIASNAGGRPAVKTLAWFPSVGCWWSRTGGCTFCHFGTIVEPGSREEVVAAFAAHLAQLDPGLRHLHVAPGGSFFSDRELDDATRRAIVGCSHAFPFLQSIGFETRPDELTLAKLLDALDAVPSSVRDVYVGFGLEARSDLVREAIVNKGYTADDVLAARDVIEQASTVWTRGRVHFETYVMIKPLFLTEREGVEEAVRTAQWSYAHGAETVVLFLNTVKHATLQHLAATSDLPWPLRFEPPYYRSGIEALRRLPAEQRARTVLLGVQSGVLADGMPRGCELCAPVLLGALMAHNFTRDAALLEHAARVHCSCRDAWRDELARSCATPLAERIEVGISLLEELL